MNHVFIGWDHRQPISYNVLQHSIIVRASAPVCIAPLKLDTLPLKRAGLTPFTFSRFLVPWLCDYRGWALFMDLDIVVRGDITEVFGLADPSYAAMVVKNKIKFEWASMILFNCEHEANRMLTPEYVERAEGLHHLKWLDEALVGGLPAEWNHCVGYDPPRRDAKLLHFTQGIPAFPETKGSEHADTWDQEWRAANSTQPWAALMGQSVHARHVYERLQREAG